MTYANSPFKAVLAWSDERGSRFSNNQLVNNLNLKVISPDGTEYWGNNFANGRSIQGGSADTVNNLEVFLVDSAQKRNLGNSGHRWKSCRFIFSDVRLSSRWAGCE